jgi:hypothetical protein
MDYEDIREQLKQYGKTLLENDIFPALLTKFKEEELTILDFIVYTNFERKSTGSKLRTYLRNLGLETRQSYNNGKNSGAPEFTVDALRTLYKTSGADLYIIISNDPYMIPLLKAIKYENKLSYVLSTRCGFNQVVAEYADFHECLEDILGLAALAPVESKPLEPILSLVPNNFTETDIERAKEVARHFYRSLTFRRAKLLNQPINLSGYIQDISKDTHRYPGELLNDFKLAHCLQFVVLYKDVSRRLYLSEGERRTEVL